MITPLLLRRLFPSRNLKPRAAWPKGKSRMAKNNQFHITCFVCVSFMKNYFFPFTKRKKNLCSLFMLHLNIHITHRSVFPRARRGKLVFGKVERSESSPHEKSQKLTRKTAPSAARCTDTCRRWDKTTVRLLGTPSCPRSMVLLWKREKKSFWWLQFWWQLEAF